MLRTDSKFLPFPFGFCGEINTSKVEPLNRTLKEEKQRQYWGSLVETGSQTSCDSEEAPWKPTSGLSHPIISPYDTWWHRQYVGSLGSTGMSKTSDGCMGRRASLKSGLEVQQNTQRISVKHDWHHTSSSLKIFNIQVCEVIHLSFLCGADRSPR